MKNTRFNTHFLLVSLLSVTVFQTYTMEPEITVTVSEKDKEAFSEWISKIINRVVGVEKRQEATEQKVNTLSGEVHNVQGNLKNIEGRVENLENKVVPAEQPKNSEPTVVQTVVDGAKKIGTTVSEKAGEAKDAVVETGKNLAGAAQKKAEEIGQGAQKLTNEIKKEGKTAMAYLHEKAKAAYDAITGAPQDTYTWTKNNPGKALAVAVAIGITIYVGYELYKASKKAAKKRIVRRVIASNVVV